MMHSMRREALVQYIADRQKDGERYTTADLQAFLVEKGLGFSGDRPEVSIWSVLRDGQFKRVLRIVHGCQIERLGREEGTGEVGARRMIMRTIECAALAKDAVDANVNAKTELASWL